jgi:uncharacterized protein YozE (UPF0346 family)
LDGCINERYPHVVHEEYTEAKDGSACEDFTSVADFETMEGAYLFTLSMFSSEVKNYLCVL